jgi:FtsH-binding integral membrane protein
MNAMKIQLVQVICIEFENYCVNCSSTSEINSTHTAMTNVYENTGSNHSMDRSAFYGLIAFFVCYGLGGSALAAHLTTQSGWMPQGWMGLIGLLILPFIGIFMSISRSWLVSFIGYNLVLIPFGILLGPSLQKYDADVVRNACLLTAGITLVMGLAGTIFPGVFSRLGSALFLSLSCLVLVRIAGIFVPELRNISAIEYIAAGIFSLYIGFDMWRASVLERTLDNAVDVAISLYLDILNLFLSILKIMGSSSDD